MKLSCKTRLPAPADTVAAVLNSVECAPQWQAGLVRMEMVRGAANQAGSLARLNYSEGGKEYIMHDELLECIPNRFWRSRISGQWFSAIVETELTEVEGATMLRLTWTGGPRPLLPRLFFPLMRGKVRNRIKSDLEALTDLVKRRMKAGGCQERRT